MLQTILIALIPIIWFIGIAYIVAVARNKFFPVRWQKWIFKVVK